MRPIAHAAIVVDRAGFEPASLQGSLEPFRISSIVIQCQADDHTGLICRSRGGPLSVEKNHTNQERQLKLNTLQHEKPGHNAYSSALSTIQLQ